MARALTKPDRDRVPTVLAIAGSDSGGGAGIQADLKAIASCGAHGMTAITAITAQNTLGVRAVEPVSPSMIIAQVEALIEDIPIDAVKIGMLGDLDTIEAVSGALELIDAAGPGTPVVVDPVMVSESGSRLLAEDAVSMLRAEILPQADVVTPNISEARVLATADPGVEQRELAGMVRALGVPAALVTGGHSEEIVDVLADANGYLEIEGPSHPVESAHGSGCTHSSAMAASLARGDEVRSAARAAREVASRAVANGLRGLGGGAGPVDALAVGSSR